MWLLLTEIYYAYVGSSPTKNILLTFFHRSASCADIYPQGILVALRIVKSEEPQLFYRFGLRLLVLKSKLFDIISLFFCLYLSTVFSFSSCPSQLFHLADPSIEALLLYAVSLSSRYAGIVSLAYYFTGLQLGLGISGT